MDENYRNKRFGSRFEAGTELAKRLEGYARIHSPVVLALPKGGVEVGAAIAHRLALPFDVLILGNISIPACGESPLGAITSDGVRMLNPAMIDLLHLEDDEIRRAVLKQARHLARCHRVYRGERPSLEVADRNVILVDDGSTSCCTLCNAVRLLRRQHADGVVVAMPVACHPTACELRLEADELVTLAEPDGQVRSQQWFGYAPPTHAAEVRRLLRGSLPEEAVVVHN